MFEYESCCRQRPQLRLPGYVLLDDTITGKYSTKARLRLWKIGVMSLRGRVTKRGCLL